jgi:hypothetical protein
LLDASDGIAQVEAETRPEVDSVQRMAKWAIAVPWTLTILGAALCSLFFAVALISDDLGFDSAMGIGLLFLAPPVLFGSTVLAAGFPVSIWTGLVMIGRWLVTRKKPRVSGRIERVWVDPPALDPIVSSKQKLRDNVAEEWVKRRWWRVAGVVLGVLVVLQIVVELASSKPTLRFDGIGSALGSLGLLLLLDLLAMAAAVFCAAFGVYPAAMLIDYLRKPPALVLSREPTPETPEIWTSEDRTKVEGVVREIEREQEAPLSHGAVAAVRIVGDVGGHAVDDADLTSFTLEADDGERVIVRGDDALVEIDVPAPEAWEVDKGLRAWLKSRGLCARQPLNLAEARLGIGDRVRVWGALSHEPGPSDGYRDRKLVRVLGDGDGAPLVIARAEAAR